MAKERSIYRVDLTSKAMKPLESRSAASLGTKERDIENLLVMNPGLLFTEPSAVLIIGQEISGESIADVLAVDSQGNLIVVEIKRGSSDRATVGQILDYAAELSTWNYNDFDERWRQHRTKADAADLFEHFKVYIENPDFDRQKFLAERKLFILASAADEGVVRIIGWLRDTYNVPIQFVPFQFYSDDHGLLLETEAIPTEPITPQRTFSRDWLFNTNETYGKGAYENMFERSVIAVHGYPPGKGEAKLERPEPGDRVFAYVNGRGIVGIGRFVDDSVSPGSGVFHAGAQREFHRRVKWDELAPLDLGITASEVGGWGYNLPVRETLCRIYNANIGDRIASELSRRTSR